MNRTSLIVALLSLGVVSCARTDAYKKDKNFYQDQEPASSGGYYSDASSGETDLKKLERLKQPKKRVVVFSFWNDTPNADDRLGDFAGEEMSRQLLSLGKVILPEDQGISAATKDFVNGDKVQVTQLSREGRRLGVNTVIVGRIAKLVFRQEREQVGLFRSAESVVGVEVEMKMFDVASGREIHNARKTGSATVKSRILFDEDLAASKDSRLEVAKEAVINAIEGLLSEASLALDKMDWAGRVAKISGNKVYINAGRRSGLIPGDILRVSSVGEEIVDPVTKAYLGRSEGLVKGTLEVTEFVGEDSCMTMVHTGGNFQEGDVVRLY